MNNEELYLAIIDLSNIVADLIRICARQGIIGVEGHYISDNYNSLLEHINHAKSNSTEQTDTE